MTYIFSKKQHITNSYNGTNLIRILQFLTTPLDAGVCSYQDDELSAGWVFDLERLCVEGFLQWLHTNEVLELEVASCSAALTELLDETLETEANALTCQEVAILDLSSHVLRQKGLVAGGRQEEKKIK